MKARRDESEGMEEAMGRRKFAGNRSMDKAMPRMKKGGKVPWMLVALPKAFVLLKW